MSRAQAAATNWINYLPVEAKEAVVLCDRKLQNRLRVDLMFTSTRYINHWVMFTEATTAP